MKRWIYISGWMPANHGTHLVKPVDLTRGRLYIFSLVPQKVNRVGVGLNFKSYNATKAKAANFRWDQFPGSKSYNIGKCRSSPFSISELTFTQIFVLWELRIRDQMLQVVRNNEIANGFPATDCTNEITGTITKMEITQFMGYGWSGSLLLYRYQSFENPGKILSF